MVQKINPHPARKCDRSPLLCIFKRCNSWESSVHFFRGPWFTSYAVQLTFLVCKRSYVLHSRILILLAFLKNYLCYLPYQSDNSYSILSFEKLILNENSSKFEHLNQHKWSEPNTHMIWWRKKKKKEKNLWVLNEEASEAQCLLRPSAPVKPNLQTERR